MENYEKLKNNVFRFLLPNFSTSLLQPPPQPPPSQQTNKMFQEYIGTSQIVSLLLLYVLQKVSSVDAYNIPHVLLNGLVLLFPTAQSINALNGAVRKHKRQAKSSSAGAKKHRTVADRINALEFESETVQQAMCVRFAGYGGFDMLVINFVVAVVGVGVIEGVRVWEYIKGVAVISGGGAGGAASSLSSLADFAKDTGVCSLTSQLSNLDAAVQTQHRLVDIFSYVLAFSLLHAVLAPHLSMYGKAFSRFWGVVVSVFYFWYMNTPALERLFDLPLSRVASDTAVRAALFSLLWTSSPPPFLLDGSAATLVKVLMSVLVFFIVSGFSHSLRQLGKVSGYVLKKPRGKFGRTKVSGEERERESEAGTARRGRTEKVGNGRSVVKKNAAGCFAVPDSQCPPTQALSCPRSVLQLPRRRREPTGGGGHPSLVLPSAPASILSRDRFSVPAALRAGLLLSLSSYSHPSPFLLFVSPHLHGSLFISFLPPSLPSFLLLQLSVLLTSLPPLLILATFFLPVLGVSSVSVGSSPSGFAVTPSSLRSVLALLWAGFYFAMVRSHLQLFLEQAIQDTAPHLQVHRVDAQKVRSCFQSRVSLLVYSAEQMSCFGVFLVLLLATTAHRDGMGSVGHAGGYAVDGGGAELGRAGVQRSGFYDNVQAVLGGKVVSGGLPFDVCPVLPWGAFPEEEAEGETEEEEEGGGRRSRKSRTSRWSDPSYGLLDFSSHAVSITDTVRDLWSRRESLQLSISRSGGYGRAIFYHDGVDFDARKLANRDDRSVAGELKVEAVKVKRLVKSVAYHTFVSPPYYAVLRDSLLAAVCFTWFVVYVSAALLEMREADPLSFTFDVSDKDVVEVEPRVQDLGNVGLTKRAKKKGE